MLQATIVVPTMAGRAALLPLSISSILAQTVSDLEVFIMGDGVDDETREVIQDLMRKDTRIRFFDHPKHERRGEPNRHQALAQARGRIIGYLCDRDLMLPNHVEVMSEVLKEADFAHSLIARVRPNGTLDFFTWFDLSNPIDRSWSARTWCPENSVPLSFAVHTLDFYRQLPYGWRTTPQGHFTDIYMWQQFLSQPQCRARSCYVPTILYFPRYHRTNWTVEQKCQELQCWSDRINRPDWKEPMLQFFIEQLEKARQEKARQHSWPSWLRACRDRVMQRYWRPIRKRFFKQR